MTDAADTCPNGHPRAGNTVRRRGWNGPPTERCFACLREHQVTVQRGIDQRRRAQIGNARRRERGEGIRRQAEEGT